MWPQSTCAIPRATGGLGRPAPGGGDRHAGWVVGVRAGGTRLAGIVLGWVGVATLLIFAITLASAGSRLGAL